MRLVNMVCVPIVTLILLCFCFDSSSSYERRYPDRIAGGFATNITEFPHQLSVEFKKGNNFFHGCGASIIHEFWALTAAHCIKGKISQDILIRSGTSSRGIGGETHAVEKYEIHPEYRDTLDFDVSLIKVSKPFRFKEVARKIELGTYPVKTGTTGWVSGWGVTEAGGDYAYELQKVSVVILDHHTCTQLNEAKPTSLTLCSDSYWTGGPCDGDDGGALVAHGQQVGVVLRAKYCGSEGHAPVYYADVWKLRGWILWTIERDVTFTPEENQEWFS